MKIVNLICILWKKNPAPLKKNIFLYFEENMIMWPKVGKCFHGKMAIKQHKSKNLGEKIGN